MIAKLRRIAAVALATGLVIAVQASPATASQEIDSFSSSISTTQAGGHPDIVTEFALDSPGAPEAARNITIESAEGVFGNPRAIQQCSSVDFALQQCQSASQAGLITLRANYESNPNFLLGTAPVYDMDPEDITPARFGFIVPILNIPITIPVTVRTADDYGLRFTVSNITQLTPLSEAKITFWANPAEEAHDGQRFAKGSPGNPAGCPESTGTGCIATPIPAAIAVHPLTDNPSLCTGEPLPVHLEVETYQDPTHITEAEDTFDPVDGCEKVTFKPVLSASPTTKEADSAAGMDIVLSNPQPLGYAVTPSQLHSAVVAFPPGLTINPDAADGQTACTDAQANFGSEGPANCPDSSKIGTIGIHSTALDGTLEGSLYIGEPKPGDQYRVFEIVDGFGMHAKLLGSFRPDPVTGQVTAYFNDLPQVPFDEFAIHLFASDRGLVATPTRCQLYTTEAEFFPWNTSLPEVVSKQNFSLSSGPQGDSCPGEIRPFAPRLAAGTSESVAGAHTHFALQLDRDDGDQFLGKLNFTMPPGLTGSLIGIDYCPEAAIAASAQNSGKAEQLIGTCPASSQIGTTNVAAGPGSHPFHATGRMYLAGPFKGAPLSLIAVTPAVAGPYDYGVQVVRVAINVDPLDGHVIADSETVPSIIGGIPIRMRSIRVSIDRPEFMINPTNCSAFSIDSQGIGDQGTVADFSSYFHVDNCSALPFKPEMTIRQVGGRKGTPRTADPSLKIDLTTRPGDANVKSVSVTLSSAFEIDSTHLGNICSEKELATTRCVGRQAIGNATTTTPLLGEPLSGPVYAVSGSGGLPRLAFLLDGQVNLLPRADTRTVRGGRLQTTVPVVPDAPIGHFQMTVFGGSKGYLSNTRDLCKHIPLVRVAMTAQNGKTRNIAVKVKVSCGSSPRSKRSHR